MLVPKAAPHFDNLLQSWKYEVRFTGKICGVEPITIPHSVNDTPNKKFRRCIRSPDLPHVFASPLWSEFVGHTAKSRGRSEMSFNRFPSTIMFRASSESANSNSFTV